MKEFITIIFFSISFGLYSQTQIVTKPTALITIKEYENSIKSISKGFQLFNPYYDEDFEDVYVSWPKVIHKPLIFKRTNDNFFPTLHTWYFYDKDSTVKWIIYNWGFANTNIEASDSVIMKQTLREKEYRNKYKEEKMNLIHLLGKPTKEDLLTETTSYLNIKTIWDLPDKRIVINMTIDKIVVAFNSEEVGKTIVIPRSAIEIKILMKE